MPFRRVQKAEPFRLTGSAAAPLAIEAKGQGLQPGSFIAGFVRGADTEPVKLFPVPKVPADYKPVHHFLEPLQTGSSTSFSDLCLFRVS